MIRKCKKCDKPLRSWNKTGICSNCYEKGYKKNYSQKKLEDKMGKKISFWATKKIRKPVIVKFKHFNGGIAKFKATKIIKKPTVVRFKKFNRTIKVIPHRLLNNHNQKKNVSRGRGDNSYNKTLEKDVVEERAKLCSSSSDLNIQKKKIEHDINFGIDYANPARVWKGIRKLLKLKEKEFDIERNQIIECWEEYFKLNKIALIGKTTPVRRKPRRRRIKNDLCDSNKI